jgi:hypothetical protein
MGIKTTLTSKKVEITHFGVSMGLHAGSSCWVNLEYLGRLEFLLGAVDSADPGPPALDDGVLEFIASPENYFPSILLYETAELIIPKLMLID